LRSADGADKVKLSKCFGRVVLGLFAAWAARGAAAPMVGYAVDDAGKAAPGVRVEAVNDQATFYFQDELAPLSVAVTDAAGKFVVDVPDTGPVALVTRRAGSRVGYYPMTTAALGGKPVGIRLSAGAKIIGRVSDSAGHAVAARVGPVVPADSPANDVRLRSVPQWVESSADGSFTIEGLRENNVYRFLVKSPGLQTADVVCTAGVTNCHVGLTSGGYSVGAELSVAGMGEQVVSNVPTRIVGDDYAEVVRADGKGVAAFSNLPAGRYLVEALVPRPRFGRGVEVQLPRDRDTTVAVHISNGYTISGQVVDADAGVPAEGVGLEFGDTVTTSGTDGFFRSEKLWYTGAQQVKVLRESGFVAGDEGAELPNLLPEADGFHDITSVTIPVRVARSLAFTFTGVETTRPLFLHVLTSGTVDRRIAVTSTALELDVYRPGDYISFAEDGTSFASQLEQTAVGNEVRIPVELRVGLGARLEGAVVHEGDRASTSSARDVVRAFSGDMRTSNVLIAETECGVDGGFAFPLMAPGRYKVRAQSGLRSVEWVAVLRGGTSTEVVLRFAGGKRFSGRVTTRDGRPVAAATLYCNAGTGPEPLVIEADADGRFEEREFPADQINELQVAQVGYKPAWAQNIALPRENYEIVLEPAPPLRVRVAGGTKARWRVQLLEPGATWKRAKPREVMVELAQGSEEVSFAVPHAGSYYVVATEVDGERVAVSKAIDWNGNAGQEPLSLRPGGRGSISGAKRGVAEYSVTAINLLLPEEQKAEYTATAKSGRFRLDDLPPGLYYVSATGQDFGWDIWALGLADGQQLTLDLDAK
jgi:hypothetical protein